VQRQYVNCAGIGNGEERQAGHQQRPNQPDLQLKSSSFT
jgi:hypothetical protein